MILLWDQLLYTSIYSMNKKEYVLSKQFLRSATSIGALVREADFAESKKDFIHKLSIARKECNEAEYWMDLLSKSSYIDSTFVIKKKYE